jgi:sulfite reductase (ferredoxin)
VPGANSVDIYTHDAGLILTPGPDGRDGAVVVAGGGLGRSHRNDDTFPRLADQLGWVPNEQILDVLEAIVTTFRDYGDRSNRKRARLKYVVHDRGVEWLKGEVEARSGHKLQTAPPLPAWRQARHYLGWHLQSDGRWYLGLPIPGGRLRNGPNMSSRAAIREILGRYADEIRLTPHQDVILCGIDPTDRDAVEQVLAEHRVPMAEKLSLPVLNSMACPALPTCGQALGEAERVLPEVTDVLAQLMAAHGLADVAVETRMTGCPNGCARPYVAELGIVGKTKTTYDLWIGGDPAGSRLARQVVESVPLAQLDEALSPLLSRYSRERHPDEAFGDWADRIGVATLAADLPTFARSST